MPQRRSAAPLDRSRRASYPNHVLRHLGYVAICKSIDAPINRTCRLKGATPERLRELIGENLSNLERVLRFNQEHDIHMYRLSSALVPFASHPVNRLAWWKENRPQLRELARILRDAEMRVSLHPGQFTTLSALEPRIVAAAVADLEYHARLLDELETGQDAKIVIHLGGLYGGEKSDAIARFAQSADALPRDIQRRLVIENDEWSFCAEDVLAASTVTGLPVVFDWLHHRANPGTATTPERAAAIVAHCFATWKPVDGIPKLHLSSQAPGKRKGSHGDWVRPTDLQSFARIAPPRAWDCMLEAKQKDLALFRLRAQLSRIAVPETGNMRSGGSTASALGG